MNHSFIISTHWLDHNPLAEQQLDQEVQHYLSTHRQQRRYRRLIFYFFEHEILHDTKKKLQWTHLHRWTNLNNPELQAMIRRQSLQDNQNFSTDISPISEHAIWHGATKIINDYLFSFIHPQDDQIWAEKRLVDALMMMLVDGNAPFLLSSLTNDHISDTVLLLRIRRDELGIIQDLLDGKHGYRSLVAVCGEHLGKYGSVPLFFDYLNLSRSSASFLSLLETETHTKLKELLIPKYEIACHLLSTLQPYSSVEITKTPYSSVFSRFGYRWSQRPWRFKILVSLWFVVFSGLFGWWSLLILPIIWWILQASVGAGDSLQKLSDIIQSRYRQYIHHNDRYLHLYETMINPDETTHQSLSAQQTISRRYDIVPFAGHELHRDVIVLSKKLLHHCSQILSNEISYDALRKELAQLQATNDWINTNALSLRIVPTDQYHEQSLCRFFALQQTLSDMCWWKHDEDIYIQTTEALNELIEIKTKQFQTQNRRRAWSDGFLVAVSSGVLWWLGAYLWNWSSFGSQVFAANSSDMLLKSLEHSTKHDAFDPILMDWLMKHLSSSDIDKLLDTLLQDKQSQTLWDTFTSLFGRKAGNALNTNMMDQRWRPLNNHGQSELFSLSFQRGLPLQTQDAHWSQMIHFLDRIYDYNNFTEYQQLIHQDRLPKTLQGLHDGTLSLTDFAKLPQTQREIITQAMFTTIESKDISWLLLDNSSALVSKTSSVRDLLERTWKHQNAITGDIFSTGDISWKIKILTQDNDLLDSFSGVRSSTWFFPTTEWLVDNSSFMFPIIKTKTKIEL